MNQHQVSTYPLPLEPPSHTHLRLTHPGHHRAPSWAPCATQKLPNSKLSVSHTVVCICQRYSLSSSHSLLLPLCPQVQKFHFHNPSFPRVDQCISLWFWTFVNMTWKLQHKKKQNNTKRAEIILVFLKKVNVLQHSTMLINWVPLVIHILPPQHIRG